MSLGTIVVDLLAKTGSFETDLDRASKVAKKRAKEIDDAFVKAGKAIGVALAAGAIGAAYALKTAVDRMDELSKAAQRANMPTEDFSRLAYAADLADVAMQDLQGAMGRLAKAQGDAASGSREQADAFAALGIAYKNADGSLRTTKDVFLDFADKFKQFQGSPEIVALGMRIFGRSFQTLIPLLKDGAQGLRDAGDEADAFGVTVSTKAGKQAEDFNDNLTRLATSVEGLKIKLLEGLVPSLNTLSLKLLDAAKSSDGFWKSLGGWAWTSGAEEANPLETMQKIDASLAKLRKSRDEMAGSLANRTPLLRNLPVIGTAGDLAMLDRQIAAQEARLAYVRQLVARTGRDPDTLSLGPLIGEPPAGPTGTLPKITANSGKKDATDPLASVLDAAIQRDFERMQDAREQADEFEGFISQLLSDDERKLRGQADAWRDLIDPTRAYTRQLEQIRALVDSGALSSADGIAAEFEVESKRSDDMLGGLPDTIKKSDDAARQLGLTFSSAFEDAILGGKSLRDVLGGIGQDILKLMIRKSITEPAANWLSSVLNFGSFFGGGKAAGGDVSAGMTYLVGERGPELFTPKSAGSITSNDKLGGKQVIVQQSLTFASNVDRAQMAAYAERIKQSTIASIRQANLSGNYALTGG